jgi:hypothetical protein
LFVDRSPGAIAVPGALRDLGFRVEIHDDHFPVETPDHVWIAETAQLDWYVITMDKRIFYSPISKTAALKWNAGIFVLRITDPTTELLVEAVERSAARIRSFIGKHDRPFFAKIFRDGSVKEWK